jgi:type II secretory pathway pseudopilin PulG
MSMVEMMVGVGILGATAVGGLQLFRNQDRAQKTVERNFEVVAVQNDIRTILANQNNCTATFGGQSPTTGSQTLIRKDINGTMTNVYQINTDLPGNVRITSYKLSRNIGNLAANETLLHLSFKRGLGTIKDDATKQIKLVYTLSGANIATCYAVSTGVDSFWFQSTVDANDIHYPTGDVGIGSSNPVAPLHIGKAPSATGEHLRLSSVSATEGGQLALMDGTGNGAWEIDNSGANNAEHMRIFRDNGENNISAVTISNTGDVDVTGAMKIGTTASGCSAANEGQMKYDSVAKDMKFCNGTAWLSMTKPPAPQLITVLYRNQTNGFANCPAGKVPVGGGCDFDSDDKSPDLSSRPTATGWACKNPQPDNDYNVYVYVLCI